MTSLLIGTVLFAASVLSFGLVFFLMRSPRLAKLDDVELLVAIVCVGITTLAALSTSTHVAAAMSWKATMAMNSGPELAAFAIVDISALVVAAALVVAGRRRGRVASPMPGFVQMPTDRLPNPANTPSRPRSRMRRAA